MKHIWKYHKDVLGVALGLFFVNVGIMHFTDVEWFTPIVPEILPFSAEFWVIVSGFPEVLCGLGLHYSENSCPCRKSDCCFANRPILGESQHVD